MHPYFGGKPAQQYLTQRINGATPEQLVAMLLEGAQRFLAQAIVALRSRDIAGKAKLVNRVSAIIEELAVRLNHEEGGEVVENLTRIYEWWLKELFEASQKNQPERLEFIGHQMADLKSTWDLVSQRQSAAMAPMAFTAEGLVG
jgi:flagellar protein FliS